MNRKKYWDIVRGYNPSCVLYIQYTTSHSVGKMTMSIAFFLEFKKKIERLLKKVEIRDIFVKNEEQCVVLCHYATLEEVYYFYGH